MVTLRYHHHHLAASAEIEFTTLFQYVLSDIATKRSSLAIEVSLQMVSGKVSFRDRLCDDIIVTEIVKEIKAKRCIDRAIQEEMFSCF